MVGTVGYDRGDRPFLGENKAAEGERENKVKNS